MDTQDKEDLDTTVINIEQTDKDTINKESDNSSDGRGDEDNIVQSNSPSLDEQPNNASAENIQLDSALEKVKSDSEEINDDLNSNNDDDAAKANTPPPNLDPNKDMQEEDLGVYVDTDDESNVSDIEQIVKRIENANAESKPRSALKKDGETMSRKRTESRIQFQDVDKFTDDGNVIEQRVKVNTPVSHVTEDGHHVESRLLESREATYQQAMNLLSTRCISTQQQQSFGPYMPEYFYIHQKRPTPMPPLKAWRGYHGNVYFEPITINSLQQIESPNLPLDRCTHRNHDMLLARSRLASRNSTKPRQPLSQKRPVTQQSVVMDRNVAIMRYDELSLEDIAWLEGQDSTGSLSLRPQTVGVRRRAVSSGFDRICKGSVSGRINRTSRYKFEPDIKIMGDKFVHPSALSPLLRSTTQYSLSNQRNVNSSPDLYHGCYRNPDHLPPVEQVRVSLRHIDNSMDVYDRMSPYTRSAKFNDDLKPFIKYSPEIKAKFGRRIISM